MNTAAGVEVEIKLHVPADTAAEVRAAIAAGRSSRTRLQAAYFDTAGRDLARQAIAWRVRREGDTWVQTLKASLPDGDGLTREEHNVVRETTEGWPDADPTLHAGTPAGDRLLATLAASGPATEQFRTDVWRTERRQTRKGTTLSLSFDEGQLIAGDATADICEIEIELVDGSPAEVVTAARGWVRTYGAWIDTVNKAQRGDLLAQGSTTAPVERTRVPSLDRRMGVDAMVRALVRACLVATLRNASALAGGLGDEEHVHRTRVDIRKMRTVLREFGPRVAGVHPSWLARLGDVFGRLGAVRDRDVVNAMAPTLTAAGAPLAMPVDVGSEGLDPGDVVREREFSLLMLELLAFARGMATPADGDENLVALVAHRLELLRRQSLRHPRRFVGLEEPAQHLIRKRLKRLRYIAELTATLFPKKRAERYVRALEAAQDALGTLNDLCVARDTFRAVAATEPGAWFAVGWLVANHDLTALACVEPLRAAARAEPYWQEVGWGDRSR